jgi:hypothetical protein
LDKKNHGTFENHESISIIELNWAFEEKISLVPHSHWKVITKQSLSSFSVTIQKEYPLLSKNIMFLPLFTTPCKCELELSTLTIKNKGKAQA